MVHAIHHVHVHHHRQDVEREMCAAYLDRNKLTVLNQLKQQHQQRLLSPRP